MSTCRFCGSELSVSVVNLGMSPLCQKHVKPEEVYNMEKFYPLHAFVCTGCWLVQLDEFESPETIFAEDYAYFSSYSDSWLQHCARYTDLMIEKFGFDTDSFVVELASNDGYLLQWFVKKQIPVLGIEPAGNVAEVAIAKGVPTEVEFFGVQTAKALSARYRKADLLLGNNVLAHVPDINDFVGGMKLMLADGGVITMEFPHLLRLIENNQFDTIYHEHFSYLSFSTVNRIFAHHGIMLFDVEELPTHGGSIRIYGRHTEDTGKPVSERVNEMLEREHKLGFETVAYYTVFEEQVKETKRKLLEFLIEAKRRGKRIVGYGAPGKGNTLLNYCGIRTDFLDYTVDRSPHKQGNFLPGTHIPIYHPDKIRETRPDYVLILPWNLKEEISRQMAHIGEWGGKFVVPIPEVLVFEPDATFVPNAN
ncbi:MAG: class I SAM-dependent methyltransferase [Saprospiraceae bacterium]|nr:methyltransferase domain-containing protein [Lewinella sp.]